MATRTDSPRTESPRAMDRGSVDKSHTLPSLREQLDEYDSQSRHGRRDEVIERGQATPWKDGTSTRRAVSKAEREASNAGVWTAALFVGITSALCLSWVVCTGLSIQPTMQPTMQPAMQPSAGVGMYEQLALFLTAGLGTLGLLAALRSVWVLSMAPRLKSQQQSIRFRAMLLCVASSYFLYDLWNGDVESHGSLLVRMSAGFPVLLPAYLGVLLRRACEGRHGTGSGNWAAWSWASAGLVVVVAGTWMWISIALAAVGTVCAVLAGHGAWEYYENRLWGITSAPSATRKPSERRGR